MCKQIMLNFSHICSSSVLFQENTDLLETITLYYLPSWFFKNEMVDLRTVDLSILRLLVETIELNSLISILNWSRRFFSLRFRDFLDISKNINNTAEHLSQTKIMNTNLQQHIVNMNCCMIWLIGLLTYEGDILR